jgi:hypothetical protein
MKIELDFAGLSKQLKTINNQKVTVGVVDRKANKPDYSKPLGTYSSLSGSVPKRRVLRKGAKNNISLKFLANILDKNAGVFSEAMDNSSNQDVINIGEAFVNGFYDDDPARDRRIETAAIAIVRNPILKKELRKSGRLIKNSEKYAKKKGFDRYGFSTGTFFDNIGAVYESW